MRRTILNGSAMGRECAPLVALAHLEGQSRRLPPWLSRPARGGTPQRGGGWPGSRTAIAQPPKGFELCAVPRIGMFSAPGAVLGQPSTSAVILLLLPADAIRILVRLRSQPGRLDRQQSGRYVWYRRLVAYQSAAAWLRRCSVPVRQCPSTNAPSACWRTWRAG
jgi:hypothetical protein